MSYRRARSSRPMSSRHLWIYDDDWDFLIQHYGGTGGGSKISKVVRTVVSAHVRVLKSKLEDIAQTPEIDLED